jgi:hypothetical protein
MWYTERRKYCSIGQHDMLRNVWGKTSETAELKNKRGSGIRRKTTRRLIAEREGRNSQPHPPP